MDIKKLDAEDKQRAVSDTILTSSLVVVVVVVHSGVEHAGQLVCQLERSAHAHHRGDLSWATTIRRSPTLSITGSSLHPRPFETIRAARVLVTNTVHVTHFFTPARVCTLDTVSLSVL